MRCQVELFEQADEVSSTGLHVQQNHRLQAQVPQRHLLEPGESMILGQQCIRPLRRHQRFGFDGRIQVVFVQDRQVESARGQTLHQLLLLAVANADFHTGVQCREAGDQLRQVQRCNCFKAADIDLPGHHVVIGQGVLFELLGHAQQFLGLAIEASTAGRQ